MNKLYYQLPGTWFGDCMPFGKDGEFYLFYLKDNRNPCPFGEPFGWDLVITSDFVNYRDMGTVIPRGGDEEQDQFLFSGSILEGEGRYHAFYTGYNRDYPKLGKPSQVLMHAVSDDLIHWTKAGQAGKANARDGAGLQLAPAQGYDPDDWRDPFVMWEEGKGQYLMLLGARKKDAKTRQSGRTVKFTSTDLKEWKFQGDFWAPNLFVMHEMPDLFKMGDWWYHIITEYSDRSKMIYRMSKSLEGPWIAPWDDAFDGRAYYAGRTFALNGKRIMFGWVATKEDCDDKKSYEWAGTFVPHEVYQRGDGTLGMKVPDTIWEAFKDRERIEDFAIESIGMRTEKVIKEHCGDLYSFEADITFTEGTRSFGIRCYDNEEAQEAYQFIFLCHENRYLCEKNPNWPWFAYMGQGTERPLELTAGRRYHIRMIVDDTIAVIYVDGVALSARLYTRPGDGLGIFASEGGVRVENCSFSNHI